MFGERTVAVDITDLRAFMTALLAASGCDDETAATLADVHLEADLRGVGVQGLNHLINSHQAKLRSGKEDPSARPEVVREGPAFALIDGHSCPGPIAAAAAAELAVEKAKQAGCATVGVRNSHDLYMAGYYADKIAAAGLIGMVFSDDVVPVVHPSGGAEAVIGSNPMAIAAPTAGDTFLADFSPIATLPTYVRYAKRYGEPLPAGVATDAAGQATTDPEQVGDGAAWAPDQGSISPLGAKGYGLLLAIDLLSGALVGCDMGTDHVTREDSRKGHLIVAIDPAAFGDPETFRRAASGRFAQLRDSRRDAVTEAIRVPGEGAAARRAANVAGGSVAIDAICWEDAEALAAELGVAAPAARRS